MKWLKFATFAAATAVASQAMAALEINVDARRFNTPANLDLGSGQGPYASTGTWWNTVNVDSSGTLGVPATFVDSQNNLTSVTVIPGGPLSYTNSNDGHTNGIASSVVDDQGWRLNGQFNAPAGITITGLDTTKLYNIYMIGANANANGNRFGYVDDNSVVASSQDPFPSAIIWETSDGTTPATFVEGANFLLFENLKPTQGSGGIYDGRLNTGAGSIGLTFGDGITGNFTQFAGFQIVEVPEPGSLALLGLGGLAMLARRRAAKA